MEETRDSRAKATLTEIGVVYWLEPTSASELARPIYVIGAKPSPPHPIKDTTK